MKVSIRSGAVRVLDETATREFRVAMCEWYVPRARPLRIRSTRDPWAILVSEVMAQQTQIARVDEAWVVFMERYPTARALARASSAAVIRAWAGLGYNRRALNLRRAAQAIVSEHDGRVPSTIEALEALPGVGPYTARAVLAIAFGQPVAAVDTNVRRVISRIVGRELTPAQLQAVADALVDRQDPATWTHASMELGATVCVSRGPRCDACPVARWCATAGAVEAPARRSPSPVPVFERTTRWLRGRIIDHLRDLDEEAWGTLPPAIGDHDAVDIESAVAALQREGMLERRPDGAVRLPSE